MLLFILGLIFHACAAQQVGPLTQEYHPSLPVEGCSKDAGCKSEASAVVMDMNWRWLHNVDAYNNCLGKVWDKELCPDPETCSKNCALEGVDEKGYTNDYKVQTLEKGVKLSYPKAPRLYMLEDDDTYKIFKLKNREFAFDVDLSSLPCGMNAAAYFIEMPSTGDNHGGSIAGAKHGTGYCDAQCPHMKFIRGQANTEGWQKHPAKTPEEEWKMVGPEGQNGICCAEMDILEANRMGATYTAHPCNFEGQKQCEGKEECGDKDKGYIGYCDKDGCGWNSYRFGAETFWGPGSEYSVDTTKPMTVVTQFITSDSTAEGDLVEIRRKYIQDGKVIKNSEASALKDGGDSLTDALCDASNKAFNASSNGFSDLGGLKAMGEALGRGMVLSLSIWDDDFGRMLWLDGEKTSVKDNVSALGVARGPCKFEFGKDKDEKAYAEKHGDIEVTFKNIRYGAIDSTYSTDSENDIVVQEELVDGVHVLGLPGPSPQARALSSAAALLIMVGGMAAMVGLRTVVAHRTTLRRGWEDVELLPIVDDAIE